MTKVFERLTGEGGISIVRGTPAAIAGKLGFTTIQDLRSLAVRANPTYRGRESKHSLFASGAEKAWNSPNKDHTRVPGQVYWDPQVTFVLDLTHEPRTPRILQPLAFWSATLGMGSRPALEEQEDGATVWTREFATLPGAEHYIHIAGAVTLAAYPGYLPGGVWQDKGSNDTILAESGFRIDSRTPPLDEALGIDTSIGREQWTIPRVDEAIANMLRAAGVIDLPAFEDLE